MTDSDEPPRKKQRGSTRRAQYFLLTGHEVGPEPYDIPHILDYTKGQVEKCPSTGKLHWQLLAFSRNPISWAKVQEAHPGFHIEIARDIKASSDYVGKLDTRVAGPYEWGDPPQQGKRTDLEGAIAMYLKHGKRAAVLAHQGTFARYAKGIEYCVDAIREGEYTPEPPHLHPHMAEFVERFLADHTPRRIYSIYDTSGKSGKSDVCAYLESQHKGFTLDGCVDYSNAAHILGKLYPFPRIVCIDVPKGDCLSKQLGFLAEKLSDGKLTTGKYDGKVLKFQQCQVLIVSNQSVPHDTWSDDRLIEVYWEQYSLNAIKRNGQVRQEGPEPQAKAGFQALSQAL